MQRCEDGLMRVCSATQLVSLDSDLHHSSNYESRIRTKSHVDSVVAIERSFSLPKRITQEDNYP